jgi:hypothetical protein
MIVSIQLGNRGALALLIIVGTLQGCILKKKETASAKAYKDPIGNLLIEFPPLDAQGNEIEPLEGSLLLESPICYYRKPLDGDTIERVTERAIPLGLAFQKGDFYLKKKDSSLGQEERLRTLLSQSAQRSASAMDVTEGDVAPHRDGTSLSLVGPSALIALVKTLFQPAAAKQAGSIILTLLRKAPIDKKTRLYKALRSIARKSRLVLTSKPVSNAVNIGSMVADISKIAAVAQVVSTTQAAENPQGSEGDLSLEIVENAVNKDPETIADGVIALAENGAISPEVSRLIEGTHSKVMRILQEDDDWLANNTLDTDGALENLYCDLRTAGQRAPADAPSCAEADVLVKPPFEFAQKAQSDGAHPCPPNPADAK